MQTSDGLSFSFFPLNFYLLWNCRNLTMSLDDVNLRFYTSFFLKLEI